MPRYQLFAIHSGMYVLKIPVRDFTMQIGARYLVPTH